MKFRTVSRFVYLKRAHHRRGHGIHSPFLFRLITTVIEDKKRVPEYKFIQALKYDALASLARISDGSFAGVFDQFKLQPTRQKKLYNKVEMPLRYGKVVFRLIRDFKPSVIFSYGPTLGVNLAAMAVAYPAAQVYQFVNRAEYGSFSEKLLCNTTLSNVRFLPENWENLVVPDFVMINYPDNPVLSKCFVQKSLKMNGSNDVMIIRGIHDSKAMEELWLDVINDYRVRISLDLFEIGIILFCKGLQKENFMLRF